MKTQQEIEREARKQDKASNPDPITGAPGSHPVGTGIGAASAGTAGAALGAMGGPVGAAAGAVVGAVVGAAAGHGIAEAIDPTVEHDYWRQNYRSRPYVKSGVDYNQYGPAYQYGWEARSQFPDEDFDDIEDDLSKDWSRKRAESKLEWDEAKSATRDAWDRVSTRKA